MGNCLKRSTADDISLLRGGRDESGRESSDFGPPEIMQPVFYPSPAIGGIGGGIIGGSSGSNSIGFGASAAAAAAAAAASSSSSSSTGSGHGHGGGAGAGSNSYSQQQQQQHSHSGTSAMFQIVHNNNNNNSSINGQQQQQHHQRSSSMFNGQLTEDEQIKMAKRIGLIQHLPIGIYAGCRKSRECVICMMEFNNGDSIRYLPCMHTYHVQCIDDWLMRSLTCPSCMEPVDAALLTTYEAT